jgi:AraC-like DNA-binding protein
VTPRSISALPSVDALPARGLTDNGGMLSEYVRGVPAPPLRPYVAWYQGYRDVDVAPTVHRGLPSPYLTLIVTLDDPLVLAAHPGPGTPPGSYDVLVGGLHTVPALITHDGRQSGIQLALSPLGARALLNLPAGELASVDVPGAEVLGPLAAQLRQRVREADSWAARFAVLDELLSRRLDAQAAPRPEVVRAWRRLVGTRGAIAVGVLAREVGWSPRYLGRQFGVEIGLGPKTAARVARFDAARRLLQTRFAQGRDWDLAGVAARCGYFDQAHLDRDFAEFAGCPPSRWLREEFGPAAGSGQVRNVQGAAARAVPDSEA